MRDFAHIALNRVLWRLRSALAVFRISARNAIHKRCSARAIGIFKAKADYIRNCKVAVGRNVSGIEGFAEIRSGNVLSGKSTSEEIDAAIELQSEQSCFEVLTFGSEGVGQATFSW